MAKKTQTPKAEPNGLAGTVVSKTRISSAYTEYVVQGEAIKAVIQAADDAFKVADKVSVK